MATKGVDSVFISVSNLENSLALYRNYVGLKVLAEDTLQPDEIQQLWNLPVGTKARTVLLKNELRPTRLELVEFTPNSGRTIREEARPWDYGIYCVAFLVKDVDLLYRELTDQGFAFVSPPIQYQPNWVPYPVKETTLIGPDNVPINHFQRMKPEKYESAGNYVRFDHCFQIVESLDEVKGFYGDILGLDLSGEMPIPEGLIDDLIPLPPGNQIKTLFYGKKDENTLIMQFVEISLKGKSLAQVARPPNLGLFMLSFEVDNLLPLMESFKKEGIAILSGPVELRTKLHGEIRAITVEDPGGAMIALFERWYES